MREKYEIKILIGNGESQHFKCKEMEIKGNEMICKGLEMEYGILGRQTERRDEVHFFMDKIVGYYLNHLKEPIHEPKDLVEDEE